MISKKVFHGAVTLGVPGDEVLATVYDDGTAMVTVARAGMSVYLHLGAAEASSVLTLLESAAAERRASCRS